MNEKVCVKCGVKKPASGFYRHKNMADSRLSKCKICIISAVTERAKKDPAKHRKTRRAIVKKRNLNPENRMKNNARAALQRAIHNKLVKKLPCVVCGAIKVEGHHDRYDRPTNVLWLCAEHHRELHNNQKIWRR